MGFANKLVGMGRDGFCQAISLHLQLIIDFEYANTYVAEKQLHISQSFDGDGVMNLKFPSYT